LGDHIEQKGSLVHPDYLRFDFSHFQKVSDEEIRAIENLVNIDIRKNFSLEEHRDLPMSKAKEMGAIALFGEKYGDVVRTIQYGDSTELCGGTHVKATGEIGLFKILSESSVAAGVRRIEAVVADRAEDFVNGQTDLLKEMSYLFKNKADVRKNVEQLLADNTVLSKQLDSLMQNMIKIEKRSLLDGAENVDDVLIIKARLRPILVQNLKDIAFQLRTESDSCIAIILAGVDDEKVQLAVALSDSLVSKGLNAVDIIRSVASEIKGGGGGQTFLATAGGKNPAGIENALLKAEAMIKEKI